jgi:FkbM family methyltransferase
MSAALQTRTIKVRGQPRDFYLRDGTSDILAFNSIINERQYDLLRLTRANDLGGYLARKKKETGKLPLIVDAGANIGASTVFFADHVLDAAILAIEPENTNYAMLAKNVEGLPNVQAVQAAIGSGSGRVRVIDPGRGHWGFRTEATTNPADHTVPCVTISDIYAQSATRCFPFMVKIDIEGGEADLFSKNTEWVASTPLLIIELHDWLLPKSASSRAFLQCISALDRDFVYIGEDIYSIMNDFEA